MKLTPSVCGALLALVCHPALASSLRDQVADRWAPTIYQETKDPLRDLIAPFDFDGDWDGRNNAANLGRYPLEPVVYYTVQETATHWLVQYLPYHPVDYKRFNGHAHDTESILVVVAKRGGPLGTLEVMETRFHEVWYQYALPGAPVGDGADDVDGPIHLDADGRPAVYAQRVGHGICGGFSPTRWLADLQLTCEHARAPHLDKRGVVYRHTAPVHPIDPTLAKQEVGYTLVELESTWWKHAADPAMYAKWGDYAGERCGTPGWRCPRNIGRALAAAGHQVASPWGQSTGHGVRAIGDTFFDPAFTISRRLTFYEPFSLAYVWNPYVGITAPTPHLAHK
jgi:hypothetical protein